MPTLKHLHTYRRVGKTDTFHCFHPRCTHHTKKELLIGKEAMCRCGTVYTLDYYALQLKFPHCPECLDPYKSKSRLTNLRDKKRREAENEMLAKKVLENELLINELNLNSKVESKPEPPKQEIIKEDGNWEI